MKRLLFILLFIPFLSNATTLQVGLPGYVSINGISYIRGYVYSIYTVVGGDSLLSIGLSNGGILITAQNKTHYNQLVGNTLYGFATMASLKSWMTANFEINVSVAVDNVIDTLTNVIRYTDTTIKVVTPTQLNDSLAKKADTVSAFMKIDSNQYKGAVTLSYYKANLPIVEDTTWLHNNAFKKPDSNSYGNAITLSYLLAHSGTTYSAGYGLNLSGTTFNTDSSKIAIWGDTVAGHRFLCTPTYVSSLGYGSGTVTSVSAGWGENFTTITTSGSTKVDSSAVTTFGTVRRIVDSGLFAYSLPLSYVDTEILTFTLTGQGTVINLQQDTIVRTVPYRCKVLGWQVVSNLTGSCQYDITISGTSIIGGSGNYPLLSSARTNSASVTSWATPTLTLGQVLYLYLTSVTGLSYIQLNLLVQKL